MTQLQFGLALFAVLVTAIGIAQLVVKLVVKLREVRRKLESDIKQLEREVTEKETAARARRAMPSRDEVIATSQALTRKFSCHTIGCPGFGKHRCHDLSCKEHAKS